MQEHITNKLILSENVVYTCQNSGDCCRNDWLIGVDTVSYAKLNDIDWGKYDTKLAQGEKFIKLDTPLPSGEKFTLVRNTCGECVFLTGDNKCSIHNHLGYKEKPQVCKEFPYCFVETPDGIAVGLSFACYAVRNHKGKSLPEQKTEIFKVLEGSYRVRKIPDPIVLISGMDISWQEYKWIEEGLLNIFNQTEFSFPMALIAGSIFNSVCISLKQVEDAARKENQTPQETLQGGLDKLKQDGYRRIFAIAANLHYPRYATLTPLAPFYTWLQFSKKRIPRFNLVFNLYRNYFKFYKGRGVLPDFITDKAPFDIAKIKNIRFMTKSTDIDNFLREYWTHVLFRKTLIPMHGVFRGYQTMLVLYGFMKWAAKLQAYHNGRKQADLEDIQDAVRLIEQRFILHAQFANIFVLSPVLTVMADRLYLHPKFVPSVVLEPQ